MISQIQMPDAQIAKIVITSRTLYGARKTISAIKRTVPDGRIRGAGLKGIFILEVEGDVQELAQRINQECSQSIGRAVAVLAEVPSTLDSIRESAIRIGKERIAEDESFCFRLHKRGEHGLDQDTPKIEHDVGGAIWKALEQRYGKSPRVDLKDPDVTILAEVFGANTAVGILKKAWR